MLTVFIPFHNEEEKDIHKFLIELKEILSHNFIEKIILDDDGSVNKTKEILEKFINLNNSLNKIILIKNLRNKGVGFSFKEALKFTTSKFIIFIPSDNDIPLTIFSNIEIFIKKNLDLVMYYPINLEKYSRYRYLISMLFRIIYGFIFDLKIHYIQAPCMYKLDELKKENFFSTRFSIWAEINLKLLKKNINYTEIGIIYKKNSYVDRSISIKNFLEVAISFLRLFFEVFISKRNKFKNKSTKFYF